MLHAPTESQLARHREATNTNRMKIQQAQLARIWQSKLRTYRSFGRLLSVSHVPSISRDVVGSHGSISKEAPGTGNHLVIYSPALHQAIDRSPAVRPATAPPRALATCTAARCARPRRPMSPTEADLSALPSRKGSPMWCRAAVPFASAPRVPLGALYTGKDSDQYKGFEESKRGSFGPGGYDVHAISRTGTPRGHIKGNSAHKFGPAPAKMRRAASANLYEGKELASKKLGSYGPGFYDVMRTSRTGTPRGKAKGIPVFGSPADQTRPDSAPYRIGSSDPDRLAQTAAGRPGTPQTTQLGLFGARECREALSSLGCALQSSDPPTQNGAKNRYGPPPERPLKAQQLPYCCGALVLCTVSTCRSSRLPNAPILTSTGGLFYDVDGVSRKGTPRDHVKGGVPVFGSAPVKSVRRAASAKRCVVALAIAHLHAVGPRPTLATIVHRRCQEGTLGGYGPGDNFDLRVSNTGTPRGHVKGGTPTFGATDRAKNKPRPDLAKLYRGRAMREATERTMRGSFGPGGYALPSGIGRQVLSQRESSCSCTFGQGTRPDFNDVNALASRGPCEESHCIPGAWVDAPVG